MQDGQIQIYFQIIMDFLSQFKVNQTNSYQSLATSDNNSYGRVNACLFIKVPFHIISFSYQTKKSPNEIGLLG